MPPRDEDSERLAENTQLTDDDVEAITKRLDELDEEATDPWTRRTLELIEQQPGIVSTVLSRQMRTDRYEFKPLVQELRRLGLVYGLDVGYSISPRGRAYLRKLAG